MSRIFIFSQVREFNDDGLVLTMTVDKVSSRQVFKRN